MKRSLHAAAMLMPGVASFIALVVLFDSQRAVKVWVILSGVVIALALLWASSRTS